MGFFTLSAKAMSPRDPKKKRFVSWQYPFSNRKSGPSNVKSGGRRLKIREDKLVAFQFLSASSINITSFRNRAPWSLPEADRRFVAIMMEAVSTPETSVYVNETTQRYIPEDCNLHELSFFYYRCRKSRESNLGSFHEVKINRTLIPTSPHIVHSSPSVMVPREFSWSIALIK
jgi:hypothetical protein